MKAKPKRHTTMTIAPQYITRRGKRMVVLDETEYERLCREADVWEPAMPKPNSSGNYPAIEALRISLARKILRHRRRAGLTQAQLAKRAGIRLETLNRIEHGEYTPSVVTVEKIDRALAKADSAPSRN